MGKGIIILRNLYLFLLLLPSLLTARAVDTFYGPIDIDEAILLELIDSPAFQRLKGIHQYGVSYYTTHQEEYSRYDHCLGVFTILRKRGAPLEEQIAGLLHDVSHTVFSHVGDWVFGKENQNKSYQDGIHSSFIQESGLADILRKYHLTIEQVVPSEKLFPALENNLPNLCADRIDYNLQGAFHQRMLSYEEVMILYHDLQFIDNRWVSHKPELMKKLMRFSIFMSQDCWGSDTNYICSRWLADAMLRGIDLGLLTFHELHFGIDQIVWEKLMQSSDSIIQTKMQMILNYSDFFSLVENEEEADLIVKSRFRGINPWIIDDSLSMRLSELDEQLAQEFDTAKRKMEKGWFIQLSVSEQNTF